VPGTQCRSFEQKSVVLPAELLLLLLLLLLLSNCENFLRVGLKH